MKLLFNGKGFVLGIIKYAIDKMIMIPKFIEETFSDGSASFLKVKRSLQFKDYDCGVHAAWSILKYYGKESSIDKIDNELNAYNRGYASEASIYKLFRKRGLKVSRHLKANLKTIKAAVDDYAAPILTSINKGDHWMVVYGYSLSHIYVLDSVYMRPFVKWKIEYFFKLWDKWGAIIYKAPS